MERLNLLRAGCFLLLLIDEGDAAVELQSASITLTKGDALLLTAMEPFAFSTGGAFLGIWVEIPVWWLIELCRGGVIGARRRLDGRLGTTAVLRETLSILLGEDRGGEEANNLVDLFGDVLARNLLIAARGEWAYEGQIDRINRFIADNYRTPGLSPRDAGRALGCSLSSIHKCCASAGWTFGGMLTSMRLSVAAHRLSRGYLGVSAVAFDCGFSSLTHFCHAFKARYGVTASSVRKQYGLIAG